jgi:transposase
LAFKEQPMSKDKRNTRQVRAAERVAQMEAGRLPVVNPDLAAIDLGSREHYVALPPDRGQAVRRFGCFTPDLERLADYLKEHRIKTVLMEATGVYWVPVFELLEQRGFDCQLVDARHLKNVSGRKSDVQDCEWVQRLGSFGLLRAAFRPKPEIVPLRSYWRHRGGLVREGARQILLMQKAMEQMNVQLHKAVDDITGLTGLRIMRAIVSGARDPQELARLRHPQCKLSEADFVAALTGTYRPEHIFALKQALEAWDFYQNQILQCDQTIQAYMTTLPSRPLAEGQTMPQVRRGKRRKNQPHFDLRAELVRISGIDLTQIDGINDLTAMLSVTESDIDTDRFPSEKHFASWLTFCPNNRKTGGAIRSTRSRRSDNRLATGLRVATQSLWRSKSSLGAFYRRTAARIGKEKATTATARKLACRVFRMRKYGTAYVDQGEAAYQKAYQERTLRNLHRQARRFGFELVNLQTGEVAS